MPDTKSRPATPAAANPIHLARGLSAAGDAGFAASSTSVRGRSAGGEDDAEIEEGAVGAAATGAATATWSVPETPDAAPPDSALPDAR